MMNWIAALLSNAIKNRNYRESCNVIKSNIKIDVVQRSIADGKKYKLFGLNKILNRYCKKNEILKLFLFIKVLDIKSYLRFIIKQIVANT